MSWLMSDAQLYNWLHILISRYNPMQRDYLQKKQPVPGS